MNIKFPPHKLPLVPHTSWNNGLYEAIHRLEEHLQIPNIMDDLKIMPDQFDARDRAALAYLLYRIKDLNLEDY